MKKLLDEHFTKSYRKAFQSHAIKCLEHKAESNRKRLRENPSEEQRVHLLRYIDSKNLITEECGEQCFVAGFKMGLITGYEANRD